MYVASDIVIDAPLPDVYDALLDYDRFAALSKSFTESRYIEPAEDGTPRVYTRIEGCIWFFCKRIDRYARLEFSPQTWVKSTAEPELSDAEYSVEEWNLSPRGDTTHIYYTHELKPGFWVPPLIGTMVIKRTLKRGSMEAAVRIEQMARNEVPPELVEQAEMIDADADQ